jgi:hypothetical protein
MWLIRKPSLDKLPFGLKKDLASREVFFAYYSVIPSTDSLVPVGNLFLQEDNPVWKR